MSAVQILGVEPTNALLFLDPFGASIIYSVVTTSKGVKRLVQVMTRMI